MALIRKQIYIDAATNKRLKAEAKRRKMSEAAIIRERLGADTVETPERAAARNGALDIFDAQLVATARAEGIRTILTEDLQSAPVIEGVRYIDPFARSFRAASLGL